MSIILDDTANFSATDRSIESYARACSDAVDNALTDWPIVERTKNASVSTGFVESNRLRSTLWTQSFDVVEEKTETVNGDQLTYDDLLSNLEDLFSSDDLEKHAKQWDATFAGATLVAKLSENDVLVHWKFDAKPLTGRDMFYIVHRQREENNISSKTDGGKKIINNNWSLRITYAYASVSEEWARQYCTEKNIDRKEIKCNNEKRVRAFNSYPTCDRLTIYGKKKIVLDHLMTTDIGGMVRPFCFNNLFKKALIKANVHECEALREYVISLCNKSS